MANVCCRFSHINKNQVENGVVHIMTKLKAGVVRILLSHPPHVATQLMGQATRNRKCCYSDAMLEKLQAHMPFHATGPPKCTLSHVIS